MGTSDTDKPAAESIHVLLYAVNGTGLGHLTRLLAIGRWIRVLLNGLNLEARIFFLTCSDADFLLAENGFPSFKLPSKTALRKASVLNPEAIGIIRDFAEVTLERLNPDILVVDTFPTGSYDELMPILGRDDVSKVFIFREQRADYAAKTPYERLLTNYDLLLMPHPRGFFELPFNPPSSLETSWSGNIVFGERKELLSRTKARQVLQIDPRRKVIYVAAGGGGDPDFDGTLDRIVRAARELEGFHIVVGAGPLSRAPRKTIKNLSWVNYFPISRLFRAFDFAISSSGYNTVNELLFFGLPAILYAQVRGADDQWLRASRVAAEGAALALEELTPAALSEALQTMSDPEVRKQISKKARSLVPRNGARHAAETILNIGLARKLPDWTTPIFGRKAS